MILDFLKIPELKQDVKRDDLELTLLHRQILVKKKALRGIYKDFYSRLLDFTQGKDFVNILEIGSGAGFIKDICPTVITSDVIEVPGIDLCCSAQAIPYQDNSLDAIMMINVLHHIKQPEEFFLEAQRCLRPGGKVVMIEPANTCFSRFIYTKFHSEIFDPQAPWIVQGDRPLYDANDALPFIIFERDRKLFEQRYPELKIVTIEKHTPFGYLLSGGFTLKQLLPSFMFSLIKAVDRFRPLAKKTGLFQTIVLEKESK